MENINDDMNEFFECEEGDHPADLTQQEHEDMQDTMEGQNNGQNSNNINRQQRPPQIQAIQREQEEAARNTRIRANTHHYNHIVRVMNNRMDRRTRRGSPESAGRNRSRTPSPGRGARQTVPTLRFECPLCDESGFTRRRLASHQRRYHPGQGADFDANTRAHMEAGNSFFLCQECGDFRGTQRTAGHPLPCQGGRRHDDNGGDQEGNRQHHQHQQARITPMAARTRRTTARTTPTTIRPTTTEVVTRRHQQERREEEKDGEDEIQRGGDETETGQEVRGGQERTEEEARERGPRRSGRRTTTSPGHYRRLNRGIWASNIETFPPTTTNQVGTGEIENGQEARATEEEQEEEAAAEEEEEEQEAAMEVDQEEERDPDWEPHQPEEPQERRGERRDINTTPVPPRRRGNTFSWALVPLLLGIFGVPTGFPQSITQRAQQDMEAFKRAYGEEDFRSICEQLREELERNGTPPPVFVEQNGSIYVTAGQQEVIFGFENN